MKALIALSLFCIGLCGAAEPALAPPSLPPDVRFKADVLLIVAHPDDDTTIGPYLARLTDMHKRVAVIYCTSGGGGGDEVGVEAGRSLGEIRIQEARRALASLGIENVWFLGNPDTAGQNALWSLDNWNHGRALDEIVRLVRLTRPNVGLTWLPDFVAGENHGDHQAAGILATEAFDLAGDPTVFSEQVSPARNPRGMMNLTEGLRTWQPQKIYYFTDAFDNFIPYWHDPKDLSPFRSNLLNGQGPTYSATDLASSQRVSYAQIAAKQLSFYQTQDGKLGQKALNSHDYKDFEYPVRFIFGKSLVGGSVTGDIFEGVSDKPVPFARANGFRPETSSNLSISLGDPWQFYQRFWKAHDIDHLAKLLPIPEIGAPFKGTLHLAMTIRNGTSNPAQITLTPVLPTGWVDESLYGRFEVAPGEALPLQVIVATPDSGKRQWEELSWNAEAEGRRIGTVTLRVYLGKGSVLPQ